MAPASRPIDRVIPRVRGGSEPKQPNRFRGDTATLKIIPSRLAGSLVGERILPALGNLLVNLKKSFFEMTALLFAGPVLGLEGNPGTLGQASHRLWKIDAFVRLDE